MVAVERDDDDRAGLLSRRDDRAVDRPQGGEQARDANRKAGRRDRFAAKAGDQAIVTPAAANRAETDRSARFVLHLERQLGLEDRAGVVFQAANDGRVDLDASRTVPRRFTNGNYLTQILERRS